MKGKRKKQIAAVLIFGTVFALGMISSLYQVKKEITTSGKTEKRVVVIDAGHGGIDPGKVGVNGSYEKDINLSIARYLKEFLETENIEVLMTRETDEGLYQPEDTRKKASDMRARMEVMNRQEVDLVISIHQNSFTSQSSKGAQVFYQASSETGEALAKILQESLISEADPENGRQAKANNSYFVLKKSEKTAVIIECGFLSNPEEEQKLLTKEYQKKIAEAIKKGVLTYFASGFERHGD